MKFNLYVNVVYIFKGFEEFKKCNKVGFRFYKIYIFLEGLKSCE